MLSLKPLKILALAATAALALAGCGGDDPVAPPAPEEEPEIEVKTPIKFLADKVYCWAWPQYKPNGDAWDTFGGRPDIYFQVGNHETIIHENHLWEVVLHSTFPSGGCRMNFGDTFTINMWDADDISADDKMSSATFSPKDFYKGRNETTGTITLKPSAGAEFYITGTWIYQ